MRRVRRRGIGHESEGGPAVLVIVLLVLVMLVAGWVAAYAGANGKIPRGTTVAGVEIGGRDRYAAVRALQRGLASEQDDPISISSGTLTLQVTPAEAGLSVDYADTVAQAVGPRSWDPRHLWGYYTGGDRLQPVVDVDSGAMEALLDRIDQEAGQPARDGAVSVAAGQVDVTTPREGAQLDREQARTALVEAWADGRADVTLPLVYTAPEIDQADVDTAVSALANPALSGPVTLAFAGSQVVLNPRDYVDLLTVVPRDGALALDVDPASLAVLVDPAAHDVAPADASVALQAGVPTVVPAVAGQSYDPAGVAAAFLQGVTAVGAARTVPVPGTASEPAFTDDAAAGLGVAEPVATYAVPAPADAGPAFGEAVARLDGALLRPGDTFSFNARVGAVTGSAARIATAAWNAGFLAGLTDVARTANPTWTDGLPEGRDATVAYGGADLQMRNDSTYGVLLSAHVSDGSLVVDAWSTKEWEVTAATGARYAVTPRTTRTDADPACVPQEGADGFAVDLVRTATKLSDATQVRSDTVTTTYLPVEAVVCSAVPPPA